MSKIIFIYLSVLIFISSKSSGKKLEEELGVSTRLPDTKMPKEFQE